MYTSISLYHVQYAYYSHIGLPESEVEVAKEHREDEEQGQQESKPPLSEVALRSWKGRGGEEGREGRGGEGREGRGGEGRGGEGRGGEGRGGDGRGGEGRGKRRGKEMKGEWVGMHA